MQFQPGLSFAPDLPRYTLCFLTRLDQVLMLLRRRPPNQGLWNGVGGHIESGEDPLSACLREVREETGYQLGDAYFAGLLTWNGFGEINQGVIYLFTAEAPPGDPTAGEEGDLAWKDRAWVTSSAQVVSNIHVFGPPVLDREPAQIYHFEYRGDQILSHARYCLPPRQSA